MASQDEKRRPAALNLTPSRSSSTNGSFTTTSSLKPPRTPRFAEATTVHSPIEPQTSNPFVGPDEITQGVQAQPADVGFGYINDDTRTQTVNMPMTPKSPLKSAMRVPGTPARKLENPLSPTFREEDILEAREKDTEAAQRKDVGLKYRVRMAKFALRGISFSCSLIIISLLAVSFNIFRSTSHLAAQSGLPPWAENTQLWPQIVVLSVSGVNLLLCILIFIGYLRGGHHRAEKVGVYYTLFAVGWFIASSVLWAAAAGILQFTRNNSNNKDMWGWSCVENKRAEVFSEKIDYALVCRLQNWSLICALIEIVLDVFTITLYSVVFYRYITKRKLTKSMDMRDRARSDLYLAQLRSQSAPNTPGFGPKSPSFSQYAMSPRFPPSTYNSLSEISGGPSFTPGTQTAEPKSAFTSQAHDTKPVEKPFKLQAPPSKARSATPKAAQSPLSGPVTTSPPEGSFTAAAPGEQQYDAVPIPGAYADAVVKSPPPSQATFGHSSR
ncbi:hypothetical protein SAMD00023353_0301570 [Rosellinia necatrix]|uniref:Hyphal anastamosis-8 protein n=1 Tax=Rosellinia necatrix TaxID=77044 RepID=A0A1W2TDG6_ROSNE|nr:hypothetical protein SAMD00023353_0301570 [Rosellinia necatrix]